MVGEDPDGPSAAHYTAARVRVVHVARTTRPHRLSTGDEARVELQVDLSTIADGLRPGINVGLLLSDNRYLSSPDPADCTTSIMPEGVTVWGLVHRRGILLEPVAGEGYVVPYDDVVHPSATMERFLDLIVPAPPPALFEPRGIQMQPHYGVPCDLARLAAVDC